MSDKLRRHIEQIVSLTDEEFAFVLSHFKPKKFRRHQIVIHEGDLAPYDFYVVKGLMKVSRVDGDGKEHIIKFGMEDWWISDAEAFNNRTPATMSGGYGGAWAYPGKQGEAMRGIAENGAFLSQEDDCRVYRVGEKDPLFYQQQRQRAISQSTFYLSGAGTAGSQGHGRVLSGRYQGNIKPVERGRLM
jgi:CRP-like cAMP-binding protein